MKVSKHGDVATISPDHPEPEIGRSLLMEAVGTANPYFLDGLLGQLANATTQGGAVDERGLNFMLAMVKGMEPKDQVEAMLAAQMAAVHNATMTFARRLAHVDNIPQQDSAERAFNKLARTFVSQVEALKRYRSGGEQTVRVEHVTVNEGGQAIVGNVSHGGRASKSGTILTKREYSFQKAPRCSAISKRTRERCKAPAVRGWTVCRFHGARGGAPNGKANGAYRHELFTAEAIEDRCALRSLIRESRELLAMLPCEANNKRRS
jgi:hypothetical protein